MDLKCIRIRWEPAAFGCPRRREGRGDMGSECIVGLANSSWCDLGMAQNMAKKRSRGQTFPRDVPIVVALTKPCRFPQTWPF